LPAEREDMAKQIKWSYSVEVVGGTRVRNSKTMLAEAVDEIDLTIDAGDTVEVGVQPGGADVTFLLIRADPDGEDVTYRVNDANADARPLDGPHLLIGKGAAGLLDPAPTTFFIENGPANDPVSISILVGRDATP
jgi:hypothetical protein